MIGKGLLRCSYSKNYTTVEVKVMRKLELVLLCAFLSIGFLSGKVRAADLSYPADFDAGTHIQTAIHDARLVAGDTVTVTGYADGQDHLPGFTMDNGVNVKSNGGPLTIRARTIEDAMFNGAVFISNSMGATLDGFIIELDMTNLEATLPYFYAVAASDDATFKNCTIRAINRKVFSLIQCTGTKPNSRIVFDNCTIEQQNAPVGWMIVSMAGYHPVFNNCTIKGSGTTASGYFSGYSVVLSGGSADFNQCQFINDAPTYGMFYMEGAIACNLTGSEFTNPNKDELHYTMHLGATGTGAPAVKAQRCAFHATDDNKYPETRFMDLNRDASTVSFENCSIWWRSGGSAANGGGNPDGAIYAEAGTLSFKQCTVVDLAPIWNGRFIQAAANHPLQIEMKNSIFDNYPAEGASLGIVFFNTDGEVPSYDCANNIRHGGTVAPGYDLSSRHEGNVGFVDTDPLLNSDKIHLTTGSPARSAGTNLNVGNDIEGNPRPANQVDLGCDQFLTPNRVGYDWSLFD